MSGDDEAGRGLLDQALDVFVYAPLGLALEARDLLPRLAERGRGQVALARLAGRFAAHEGRRHAERLVEDLVGSDRSDPDTVPAAGDADAGDAGAADADATTTPPVELAIEGYDELSAPQILPLLEGLDTDQLEGILAHERAHRARATVINRIHQLLA
ncbi:MAG: hypothetical protein D6683_01640 [Actinomyces sp.]|nr:MAG: hypothetical protein D6683_01640 [Actinomyces sp.]